MRQPFELRLLRGLTRRLPAVPKAAGLANHLVRRFYLRKPRAPVRAVVRGLRFDLDPGELVDGLMLFVPQLHDRVELDYLEANLGPGDVFLDLGAYIGLYSLVAARAGARVLAVEADPETADRLRHHAALNDVSVDCIGAAVGDRSGTATLYRDTRGNRGASSLLGTQGTAVEVPCTTVPILLSDAGAPRVTLAKLDLEGLEYRTLAHWITHGSLPDRLVVEHHPGRVQAAGGDALALLRRQGYRVRPGSRHNWIAERSP